MAVTSDTTLAELERLKAELDGLLPLLSKWRVEELQQQLSHFYMRKWKRGHIAKYGALNKGFTDEELAKFLGVIKDSRFRLLFGFQSCLALRIGEVCKVNVQDFDFRIRELKIRTEKSHTLDTLIVPKFLFDETLEYIREHAREIDGAEGYLFYPDKIKSHDKTPYINLNYARRIFRYYVALAGLDEVYDLSEETSPNRSKRKLHRLSTHSLRHYGITHFSKAVNGNVVLTNRFARHSKKSIAVTMGYINTSKEELYSAIEGAFSQNPVKTIESEIYEK